MESQKNYTPQPVEKYPFEARKKIIDAVKETKDLEKLQDIIDPIEATYPGIYKFVLNNIIGL